MSQTAINDQELEYLQDKPLKSVDLFKCPVSNLSPVCQENLEEIVISGSQVEDLTPLSECPLRKLEMRATKIESLNTEIQKLKKHNTQLEKDLNKEIENIKEITPSNEKTPITEVIQNSSIQDKSLQPKTARIILEALSDSYIQVRDKNANQLLTTKLLKKGQTYPVPERSGLTLITGNAGALRILVDGIAVPKIGPIGAIRRNVILDPIKLKDGSAVVD